MITDKEVEEVVNEYVKSITYRYLDTPKANAAIDFRAGAKWMQEKMSSRDERKDFTLKFEIEACKQCKKAEVWCAYHTNKIVRLGLNDK